MLRTCREFEKECAQLGLHVPKIVNGEKRQKAIDIDANSSISYPSDHLLTHSLILMLPPGCHVWQTENTEPVSTVLYASGILALPFLLTPLHLLP